MSYSLNIAIARMCSNVIFSWRVGTYNQPMARQCLGALIYGQIGETRFLGGFGTIGMPETGPFAAIRRLCGSERKLPAFGARTLRGFIGIMVD